MGSDPAVAPPYSPATTNFPNPGVISLTTNSIVDPSGGDVQGFVASVAAVEAAVRTGGCTCGRKVLFQVTSGLTHHIHPQTDPPDTRAHTRHVRTTDAQKGKEGPRGLKSNSPMFSSASHQGPQNEAQPTALSLASTSVFVCPSVPPSLPSLGICTCWHLHFQHTSGFSGDFPTPQAGQGVGMEGLSGLPQQL